MFPTTHCQSCATADVNNEFIFEAARCGCGVLRCHNKLICFQCHKEENESRECDTEGCGNKRHGKRVFCKSCRNQNVMCPISCVLCGEGITWNVGNTKRGKKAGIRACIGKYNMDCFRRCNTYKGGVCGEEGGNDGRCLGDRYFDKKIQKYKSKICGFRRCQTGCTLLSRDDDDEGGA